MFVIIISLMMTKGVFAQSRSGYGKPLATYKAAEGFTITSYSSRWNTYSKLREVAKELLSNEHAEEISYLKNIYIYPDSPDGILAYTHYDLARNYSGNYTYKNNAYIELFDGDHYKNVGEMAGVLSHEYGHHFTIYHLIKKENKFFNEWKSTGYARVRNIANHPHVSYETDAIGDLYKWDIMEMAAEDYVQLFGSSKARKSITYKDIQQSIDESISTHFNYVQGFNMAPQDNLEIPLAADVRGLEQYWRSLANMPKQKNTKMPKKPEIRLTSKKEVATGRYQYRIEWDKLPGNENCEYTLVSYPDGEYGFPHPIKTVKPGEGTYAFVGNGLKTNGQTGKQQLVLDDYNGRYTFRLYIKDEDNKIYSAEPFHVNFNYPDIQHKGLYKDMDPTDWSYDAVRQLNKRRIMVGSTDQYFYPLKSVSYSEVITILSRIDSTINMRTVPIQNTTITRDDMALLLYHFLISKGAPLKATNKNLKFKDHANITNKKEVTYLYNTGVLNGNKGYYYPQNNVTRQELGSIIIRTLKY